MLCIMLLHLLVFSYQPNVSVFLPHDTANFSGKTKSFAIINHFMQVILCRFLHPTTLYCSHNSLVLIYCDNRTAKQQSDAGERKIQLVRKKQTNHSNASCYANYNCTSRKFWIMLITQIFTRDVCKVRGLVAAVMQREAVTVTPSCCGGGNVVVAWSSSL
jgi:hypothetical protein